MFSSRIFFILLLAVIFLAQTASAQQSFLRNLKLGDRGEDVRELQKVLNKDIRTKVVSAGPGSLGSETDYFGPLTRAAVIVFQETFAENILKPEGLIFGTGFVGPRTRQFLNTNQTAPVAQIRPTSQTEAPVQTAVQPQSNTPVQPQAISSIGAVGNQAFNFSFDFDNGGKPFLTTPSTHEAFPGETVTVSGAFFSEFGNSVLLDGKLLVGNVVSNRNKSAVSFTVPTAANPGVYELSVKNSSNRESDQKLFFVVKDRSAIRPKLEKISPAEIFYGLEVVIHGEGFSKTGNTVITNYTLVKNLSSEDGKTIRFKAEPYPETIGIYSDFIQNQNQNMNWPVSVFVANNGGISSARATFVIKF